MPQIYVSAPTTVTVNWGTTGDKVLLTITDNLPAGNKIVLFALGWDSAAYVGAQGYLKIVTDSTTLVQEGITYYLNYLRTRAMPVMLFAYHSNAPANAQYTFIATVTTAATGSSTIHVQGMVILLIEPAFFTTGINTSIGAGATVTLATVNTNFPAGSKVAVLAYVQMGVTSTTAGNRIYEAGNIRILKGSTIISQSQFQVGTRQATEPSLVSLSYLDASSDANSSYSIQVYNSLSETSQAWGEIIAFRVNDGAFLDTDSVALTSGSQVTVGNLITSLSGEVGVIALAAAENTGSLDVTAFDADDVVLQLNDQTTDQVANLRGWYILRTSYPGRSGVYALFRVDVGVSSPSYQVKMTARASGINGEAKILAFMLLTGQDIKKTIGETVNISEALRRFRARVRRTDEQVRLQESSKRVRIMVRKIGEQVGFQEIIKRARIMARRMGEQFNVAEAWNLARQRVRKIGEAMNISETMSRIKRIFKTKAENIGIIEMANITRKITRLKAEYVNVAEIAEKARRMARKISETLNISQIFSMAKGIAYSFSEIVRLYETWRKFRNLTRIILEQAIVGEIMEKAIKYVKIISEDVRNAETVKTMRTLVRKFGEFVSILEDKAKILGVVKIISEALRVEETYLSVRKLVKIIVESVEILWGKVVLRNIIKVKFEVLKITERIKGRMLRVLARILGSLDKIRLEKSLSKKKGIGSRG